MSSALLVSKMVWIFLHKASVAVCAAESFLAGLAFFTAGFFTAATFFAGFAGAAFAAGFFTALAAVGFFAAAFFAEAEEAEALTVACFFAVARGGIAVTPQGEFSGIMAQECFFSKRFS